VKNYDTKLIEMFLSKLS